VERRVSDGRARRSDAWSDGVLTGQGSADTASSLVDRGHPPTLALVRRWQWMHWRHQTDGLIRLTNGAGDPSCET
jgi:hypothetical protein